MCVCTCVCVCVCARALTYGMHARSSNCIATRLRISLHFRVFRRRCRNFAMRLLGRALAIEPGDEVLHFLGFALAAGLSAKVKRRLVLARTWYTHVVTRLPVDTPGTPALLTLHPPSKKSPPRAVFTHPCPHADTDRRAPTIARPARDFSECSAAAFPSPPWTPAGPQGRRAP